MNGIHDLGGKHGVGELEVEQNEPVFHAEWEKKVFSIFFGLAPHGFFNLDEFRHSIERMGAARYLNTSYYDHWLTSFETLLVEKGVITAEELAARCAEIAKETT
jgi:nitrile hydratase subunit beta